MPLDPDNPFTVETKDATAILHGFDEDLWEIEVALGAGVSVKVTGRPHQPPNEWWVVSAEWWLDRRTPQEIADPGIHVAKLQCYGEVKEAIEAVVREYKP